MCHWNVSLLIDKTKLPHENDVLCDLHGKWELSRKKLLDFVQVNSSLEKADATNMNNSNLIYVQRRIYYNVDPRDFHKVLISVQNYSVVCLQYYFDDEEHEVIPTNPHGNSKSIQPYVRTKKSVHEDIKKSEKTAKDTISTMYNEAGGSAGIKGPNEIPRNGQQIYE